MLGFGLMVTQNAQAAGNIAVTKAPCEGTALTSGTVPFIDNSNCDTGGGWNARQAIAPYAQVLANDSYTFIGISHPSLATAHTSIGVVVEALNMVTVPNTTSGRAAVFTVSAGETHRVFIVNQSHSTINLNNAAFTDDNTHLITTSDAGQFGSIRVMSIGTEPSHASNTLKRPGWYTGTTHNTLQRMDNLNQLSMWGVVYQTSNGAGFALEFVGDMHDSSVTGSGTFVEAATGTEILLKNTSGAGRGIN